MGVGGKDLRGVDGEEEDDEEGGTRKVIGPVGEWLFS
jgi:hypothetical protein